MNGFDTDAVVNAPPKGSELLSLIEELYPICRSITGNGFRESVELLRRHIPLQAYEVPSGTKVFDWTVPNEWNVRDAYVKNAEGQRVIDFRKSNLHVLGYSVPVRRSMSLAELKPHLFTLPERPDWIPYRTSYYEENWGFCLSHHDYLELSDGQYEVVIDSDLDSGSLTYGELYLQGSEENEILISCHACHPSMCNDNLSGVVVATMLAKQIGLIARRYSYRFVFVPGTIGAITWLAQNERRVSNVTHGLVLANLGDSSGMTYKKSRLGNAEIDRAVSNVLESSRVDHTIVDFEPFGSDERQYCSPGFNLPVGCLSRAPSGSYPESHTSADDLSFVTADKLGESFALVSEALRVLECNRTFMNLNPKCEPQLGKRGLYKHSGEAERALMWVLNLSDGNHDLLDIAEKARMKFAMIYEAAMRLVDGHLLKPLDDW
jgi:aminopeptidase-like protein